MVNFFNITRFIIGFVLNSKMEDKISLKVQTLIGMLSVMEVYPKDSPSQKDIFKSMEDIMEQLRENQVEFDRFVRKEHLIVTFPFYLKDTYMQ